MFFTLITLEDFLLGGLYLIAKLFGESSRKVLRCSILCFGIDHSGGNSARRVLHTLDAFSQMLGEDIYALMAATTYYHRSDYTIIALSASLVIQIVQNISENGAGIETMLIAFFDPF